MKKLCMLNIKLSIIRVKSLFYMLYKTIFEIQLIFIELTFLKFLLKYFEISSCRS